MFGIRQIDKMHQQDILLENEPFPLWGRMIPSYEKEKWSYSIVKFGRQDTGEMCFPNENYDFDSMSRNSTFIGAYDNGKCIGLAILRDGFLRYWYLYDLKVKQDYRRQGAASMLIEKQKNLPPKKAISAFIHKPRTIIFLPAFFISTTVFASADLTQRFIMGPTKRERLTSCFIWIFYLVAVLFPLSPQ